jgi:hypothetical protein
MPTTWKNWAPHALVLIGALLFVDLFLDWHGASVSVTGVLDVEAGSSAWAGWGAIAGVLLVALLLWEGSRLAGADVVQRASAAIVSLVLALGVAVFTAIEFFSGTADVQAGPLVAVGVHGRQWPAYAGLVLATLLAVTAVAQLGRPAERHRGRLGPGVR